jgi:hypothetical protein
MFLYSKTPFFHRNLDRNAFIDYYYTRMKNKIKLIPYLFAFNVLATLFTLAWMAVMFPYYLFCAIADSFNQIFALAKRENKRIWDAIPYSSKKEPTEPNQTKNEVPEWLQ